MITQIDRLTSSYGTFEDDLDLDKFQPIVRRQLHEYPVSSQTARTRARMRGRSHTPARRKALPFNGPNRRGRGKWAALWS